jgi:putative transcriptional regulator
MIKRNLFAEITEGFEALVEERAGREALCTHEVEWLPAPSVNAAEIIAVCERLDLSRPLGQEGQNRMHKRLY